MSSKLFIFIMIIWLIGAFLGATFEQHDVAGTWEGNTEVSTLSYLMNYKNATQQVPVFGLMSIPFPNGEYFTTWFRVLTMQFYFLQGTGYQMFYWIVLAPLSILGALSMVMLFLAMISGNITWGVLM